MRFGLLVIIVVLVGGFIFWRDISGVVRGGRSNSTKAIIQESKTARSDNAAWRGGVKVAQQWDMPAVLKEISGIAYMDGERFACIQDEKG
ncbi:MAG TPA: hypothetical protein VGE06_00715, partial [Flavisolibacter sp.]